MDRANAALAEYLARSGAPVHLVTHEADPALLAMGRVQLVSVPRPFSSAFAGELALDRAARRVAAALRADGRQVCVVGNGGSCTAADVNWVHSVHRAWPCRDAGAPAWFRTKNRLYKTWARARERRALNAARIVIANSHRTEREVTGLLGIPAGRVQTIYLGSDPTWQPPGPDARTRARARWASDPASTLVVFVGALGYDTNKGFDRLLDAWRLLRSGGWRGELVVAGAGHHTWEARSGDVSDSVRFVGHIADVGELLNAADLFVSPVSYESYGLAVHEALCRGVPAIVSASAGVVERLPGSFAPLLLSERAGPEEISSGILAWSSARERWTSVTAHVSSLLRGYQEQQMAQRIVAVATATG